MGSIGRTAFLMALLLFVASCSAGSETEVGTEQAGRSREPVTVENCGREVTFEEPPARAVALDANTAETMLSLGLAERTVGVSGVDDESDVLPELRDDLSKVPERIGEWQPSLERVLGTDPDLVVGGWNNGFYEETGVTPERLGGMGIETYTLTQTCPGDDSGVSMEDVYADVTNLGRIFGVEKRAQELVSGYKEKVSGVRSKVPDGAPLRVFVYDSGEKEAMTASEGSLANEIVELAGAENVFADAEVGQFKGWPVVGWEEVVERDPEFIVVVDYGEPSAEQKIAFLKSNPAVADVEAIREERFAVVPLTDLSPGVRNAAAVERLAAEFYLGAFEGEDTPDTGGGE
jgi:iron complex transport system substrate-binding protein